MIPIKHALAGLGAVLAMTVATSAMAQKTVVGVSWSNFQEERWKTDEAAIKARLTELGADYISADAQSSPSKQLADVESLISRGATALIVLAQDNNAIMPAIAKATAEGIPVVGYDRLIEAPGVFYLTFDNKEVGRIQARQILKVQPKGNYVFIKGSAADPNADFLHAGQLEVLKPSIDKGDIKVVGEQYTDGWLPENAQRNMEQILTAEQQQGRCGRSLQRRHRRRRHRGAFGPGAAGDSRFRPGCRSGRPQPRRARSSDRQRLEGRAGTGQELRRKSPSRWPRGRSPRRSRASPSGTRDPSTLRWTPSS